MLVSLIAVIVLLAASAAVANHLLDWEQDSGWAFIGGSLSAIVCVGSFIWLIWLAFAGIQWRGAQVQADLLNREYGTNYTQEDVFYASSMIDVIRELDRKRYEINGDIRRQRDPQRDKYQRQDAR